MTNVRLVAHPLVRNLGVSALALLGMASPAKATPIVMSVTQYSYDALERVQCTAQRLNPNVYGSLPASACTLGTAGSDGPDRITQNVYDAASQLTQVLRGVGTTSQQATATYAYTNADGKMTDVIDANGNHAQFHYDGFNRPDQWIFPSKTPASSFNASTQATALATANAPDPNDYEGYGYDANGNRTSLRKRDGTTLTYQVDSLNRVTSKVVPASAGGAAGYTVNSSYDLVGRQLTATFASNGLGITNQYDLPNFGTSSSSNMDGTTRTVTSTHDAAGNRTAITETPGSYSAGFTYDALNRMTAYQGWAAINYDDKGRRGALNFGSSGTTSSATYGYDAIDRLTSLTRDLAGTTSDETLTLSYNPASQINSRVSSNNSYVYSGFGNLNLTYTPNGLNQYTAVGTSNFNYDANGNLTSDASNSFVYDDENRLVSVSGDHTATLSYDPLGRLWQVTAPSGTTDFVYDGDHELMEYDGTGNLKQSFVWGPGADEPLVVTDSSGTKMLHADNEGSILSIADSGGNMTAINTYDEYGVPGASNQGRFQFTGQAWLSEIGMYYYKARMYSPGLGRFMQTDPVGYKDQINLYEYAGDDPTNGSDPTGNQVCWTCLWQKAQSSFPVLTEDYWLHGRPANSSRARNLGNAAAVAGGVATTHEVMAEAAEKWGRATAKQVIPVRALGYVAVAAGTIAQAGSLEEKGHSRGAAVAGAGTATGAGLGAGTLIEAGLGETIEPLGGGVALPLITYFVTDASGAGNLIADKTANSIDQKNGRRQQNATCLPNGPAAVGVIAYGC